MAYEVLKGCKKYAIQRVINPVTYWVTEYESGKSLKKEMNNLGCLLASDVERLTNIEKVQIGDIIAVLVGKGFQRGLVTDIYNRNYMITYCILLTDSGNVIETNEGNLYIIKNKELKNKNSNTSEVLIPGIQPAAVEIKYVQNFFSEVFQKKCCDNWLPGAFQFVKDLIKNVPYVFIKPVHCDKEKILGEIFIVRETDGGVISLSQQLCEKGFALPQSDLMKNKELGLQGDISLEDKIPDSALDSKLQICTVPESVNVNQRKSKTSTLSVSQVSSKSSDRMNKVSGVQRKFSYFSNGNSEKISPTTSQNSHTGSYSSSWILKKYQINSSSSSCDNFVREDQKTGEVLDKCKGSFFKVVQRNLELYNKVNQNKN